MIRGLFGRLMVSLCGVAAASTVLALVIQERSLSSDLEQAAERRLGNAAAAAGRLLDGHLDAMGERYRAVSRTPQFRATLEVDDAPTLARYAETLLTQHDAARIAFVDGLGRVVASAGHEALAGRMGALDDGLVAHDGTTYAVVSVPIAGAGHLAAAEPITAETLAFWSELCGARIAFAAAGSEASEGIHRTVRDVDGLAMRVSSSLDAERRAMGTARRNLAMAGALCIALALLVSLFVSRGLVRPIRELKEAARSFGSGDLTVHIETGRADEIGDMARAFQEMGTQLREMIVRVASTADLIDATASDIDEGATRHLEVARAQQRGYDEAAATLSEIEERVTRFAGSAGDSAHGIGRTIEASGESFQELSTSGRSLEQGADRLWAQVEAIAEAVEQLAASAEQMSGDADGLLPMVEATASSMDEVAATASSVNQNAAETRRLSERVVTTAEDGRRVVRNAVEGMETTLETIAQSERVIEALRSRTGEIGSILSVIGDVTNETALLALNASIIAAQAGEYGRSFGVVADQMKALSDRVHSSTREIESVVQSVQDESTAAVESIAAGSARAKEGAALIVRAETALTEITQAARETGSRMGESANATAEQMLAAASVAKQVDEVREGMSRIREAACAQASTNASLRNGSDSLRGVAQDVRAAVASQTRGATRIGASIEAVKHAVEEIAGALEAQGESGRQVAAVIRQSMELGHSHESAAEQMARAARNLGQQAEAMREAVRCFRIARPPAG